MNKYEAYIKDNLNRIVCFLILILLFFAFINTNSDKDLITDYYDKQSVKIKKLDRKINQYTKLLSLYYENIKLVGKKLPFANKYLSGSILKLVAVSRYNESITSRGRLNEIFEDYEKFESIDSYYITDYESKTSFLKAKLIRLNTIPDNVYSPCVFLIDGSGTILLKFNIKNEYIFEEFQFIRNSISTIIAESSIKNTAVNK